MAFDLKKFYRELDEHYAAHDNEVTEQFFLTMRERAMEEGRDIPVSDGCPMCAPPMEPNWAYVAVCNEMACFYRGLSRFEESLETFTYAEKELLSLQLQDTAEYATILLNKAGLYRYMGDTEQALALFRQSAGILEVHQETSASILAGLYNNIGLVYLDKGELEASVDSLKKALDIVEKRPEMIVELGSTWNNLSSAYLAMQRYDEAKKAVDHAVELFAGLDGGTNPHYAAALNTRGTLAFYEEDYEEALADFQLSLEKTRLVYGENVEYAAGCENCRLVCEKLGNTEEAEAWGVRGAAVRKRLGLV